jgi:3-hydroxyacyl-[acyl-carrier-protein] dehydratase
MQSFRGIRPVSRSKYRFAFSSFSSAFFRLLPFRLLGFNVKRDLAIPKDHPAYEGHFPGNPLLPGVVLLAEAMAALGAMERNVENAKFLAPVTPGMPLTLSHETLQSGGLRIEIESPQGLVATATLSAP